MTEAPAHSQASSETTARATPRWHILLARTLTVVGILLVVVSLLANFVKRTALDNSHFRSTARQIVADPTIRDQLALTMVDQLYANVDVSAALSDRLPKNLQGIAAPIAGATREVSNTAAQTLLDMIGALDDNDDVQNVYANFELSDDALAKFAA